MTTNHTSNYERARREFEDIARSPEARVGDRNEATTRLHLINRLLIDCLGWPLDEAIAEDRLDGRYADYKLGKPIPRFLVEAKREGIWFELPAGFDRPTCPTEQLFEGNQAIEGAIRQACSYAQERGIPIGAVSNGHQWIAFAASRQDGVPPLTGRALIFSSLDDIGSRFREFWNYLSKPGIEVLNILQAIGVSPPAPPPEKLSQRLIHYPGYKNRNRLQASLQILGDFFLEDLVKAADLEQDFLRECYSPSGALSQYAVISREILRTRYSLLFQSEAEIHAQPARTKTGISGELRGDIVAASFGRRPIILLGDVGVGKSIFIRHLINVDAKDLLERALVLYVDFGSEPAFPDRLNEYVMDQFTEQLRSRYDIDIEERNFVRGVYHGELLRFERGIYADLKEIDEAAYHERRSAFCHRRYRTGPNTYGRVSTMRPAGRAGRLLCFSTMSISGRSSSRRKCSSWLSLWPRHGQAQSSLPSDRKRSTEVGQRDRCLRINLASLPSRHRASTLSLTSDCNLLESSWPVRTSWRLWAGMYLYRRTRCPDI